jgi:hypothetical protein
MNTRTPNAPRRVFRYLYLGVILLVLAVPVYAAIIGFNSGDDPVGCAVLAAYLAFLYLGTPLLVVFLGLNIWGFVADRSRRLRYGLVILPLAIWIGWAIYKCNTMPFP